MITSFQNNLRVIPFLLFCIYAYISTDWKFNDRLIGLAVFAVVFCVMIVKQYQCEEDTQKKRVKIITLFVFVATSVAYWLILSTF
jgi:hypothetical protein